MRRIKLNFSVTVLSLGLKAKISKILDFAKRKFWRELRTRPSFDRCEHQTKVSVRQDSALRGFANRKEEISGNTLNSHHHTQLASEARR